MVGTIAARIERPSASHYIGSGKVEEVLAACEATGADVVLFNHTLSPVQERNLAKALDRRVVDRTGLILDIFAQRAVSHEGKLQVELAQLEHLSPRAWCAAAADSTASAAARSACAARAKPAWKPIAGCCRSAASNCKPGWTKSKCSAPRCDARACATPFREWRWSATPTPANRPCSTR